jgi:hypothetical protein
MPKPKPTSRKIIKSLNSAPVRHPRTGDRATKIYCGEPDLELLKNTLTGEPEIPEIFIPETPIVTSRFLPPGTMIIGYGKEMGMSSAAHTLHIY